MKLSQKKDFKTLNYNKKKTNDSLYVKNILSEKININFKNIDSKLEETLENILKEKEGICIKEGFVKPTSIKLMSYSCGELYSNNVEFQVLYECLLTNPVESMQLNCVVKSITKIGIRAELNDEYSPFLVFIARDHHYNNEYFSKIKQNDIINVKVIGQRYELYDKYISIIGELIDFDKEKTIINELNED
jgi:DNA-directed RNA polymerase subunit E'/Rpb7